MPNQLFHANDDQERDVKNTTLKRFMIGTLALALGLVAGGNAQANTEDAATGYFNGHLDLGYRNVQLDDDKSRVLEYASPKSSMTGDLLINAGREQKRFYLLGNFLNDQDYRGELNLDYRGLLRVELGTENLVHNLEHIPYANRVAPPDNQSYPGQNGYLSYADQNPGDEYAVEINQSSAHTRFKHPTYPAHLDLKYWRFERDGRQQLRFGDEGHGNIPGATDGQDCRRCHMESKSRDVDWVTDEFSAGVDAHVGPVDVIVEQLYREFRDQNAIPTDLFGTHTYRDLANGPTVHQHDEAPDSKLTKTSLKLHSSLAGGLVGAASGSIGSMENQSKLTDVRPVRAETDFLQLAGDATYIVNPRWTLNFRYRMTDLDTDNTDLLVADGTLPDNGPLPVRDSIDVTRASYEASVSYRPSRSYTFRGEYRYLVIDRGNTDGPVDFELGSAANGAASGTIFQPDLSWELPSRETVQRARLSALMRPLGSRRLQIKMHYTFETSGDPAYETSFEDRHDLFAGATWNSGSLWGLHGSARYTHEKNDGHLLFLPNGTKLPDLSSVFQVFNPTRTREVTNLVAGGWVMPLERLTINANYGYLKTAIDQDLIFGGQPSESGPGDPANYSIFDDDVPFDQTVQTATFLLDWQIVEALHCSLEGRLIESKSSYNPNFPPTTLSFSGNDVVQTSDGLKQLSELDITQTGMTFGLGWNPRPAWTCSASYSYDDYEDHTGNQFQGTVEILMASVGFKW